MSQEDETSPVQHDGGHGQTKMDRWAVWLAVAGGLGIVIGIVALIIAISANHSASSTKRSTKELRAEATTVVAGVDARLRRDSSRASMLLKDVNTADGRADRVHAQLRRDLKATAAAVQQNTAGVNANKQSIQGLQDSVSTLSASIKNLNPTVRTLGNQVARLQAGQRALNRRVTALGG